MFSCDFFQHFQNNLWETHLWTGASECHHGKQKMYQQRKYRIMVLCYAQLQYLQRVGFWLSYMIFVALPEATIRGVLWKKVSLEISQKSQENTCAWCFLVNTCEFLWYSFFTEHLWWLLLHFLPHISSPSPSVFFSSDNCLILERKYWFELLFPEKKNRKKKKRILLCRYQLL